MINIFTPRTKQLTVRLEGNRYDLRVVLLLNGRVLVSMPYLAARELARALLVQAGRADGMIHAPEIIADQALLFRAGSPFAITRRPALLHEARKLAQDDPTLRRALPGRTIPEGSVGMPSIHVGGGRGTQEEEG